MSATPRRLDSTRHPLVMGWRQLATPAGRREAGAFVVEGEHGVEEALAAGAAIRALLTTRDDHALLVGASPATEVFHVSRAVMEAVCEAQTPQAIAAIVAMPARPRPDRPRRGRWIVLDGVQDPGHVGTLIRTAAAAGLDGVLVGDGCADPYGPKAVRASQGALFHVDVVDRAPLASWLEMLRDACIPLYATVVEGGAFPTDAQAGDAWALLLGGEGRGLAPAMVQGADVRLTIPMPGGIESLSLPVAAGILIYRLAAPRLW